jgi:hypothetical protein
MRLTSDFWVSAYIRQCHLENNYAVVRRRGASEAGAIWAVVDDLQGNEKLFAPAPPDMHDTNTSQRRFVEVPLEGGREAVNKRLEREQAFDTDMWVVEVECHTGNHGLPV